MNNYKLSSVKLNPAKCALDLGDGSERAEYVNQDYILEKLGRPHRNINIMYTYYPNDKEWPERISVACKDMDIHFQWDYPYDDYFPYGGGIKGDTNNEPFLSMRDIRKHGQDVTLTLTMDCSLKEEELRHIARELKPFGRMRLRINHECAGTWFTHNQRYTYKEIGEFFVKFHTIIKEEAPNILTVFCAGFIKEDTGRVEYEEEFLKAYQVADIWSGDCYLALHFGWPYDVCEKDTNSYHTYTVDEFYHRLKKTSQRLNSINEGNAKPLVVSEFNTDGDVTGPMKQGDSILRFADMLSKESDPFLSGFTLYQFRDRGRLGLEIESPNNKEVGIEQPLLNDYKKILHHPFFMPELEIVNYNEVALPCKLRWGSAEDAEGLGIELSIEKTPVFCEMTFKEELNLMIEFRGKWFYKAPNTKVIDLMSAFFNHPVEESECVMLKIFAPPADGVNEPDQGDDWSYNYWCTMNELPQFRIRYEAVADVE